MPRHKKEILEGSDSKSRTPTDIHVNAEATSATTAEKPKRDNLFCESVPRDIVNEALHTLRFDSIEDTRVFTLKDLKPELFDPALLLIEPYYIPCKAKKYLHGEMNNYRVLTVFRQLLRSQGYGLFSQERTVRGKKELHYQIRPVVFNDEDTAVAVVVTFN
jgi:hypothetical protein